MGNVHDWMKDRKGSLGNVYDWRSLTKGLKWLTDVNRKCSNRRSCLVKRGSHIFKAALKTSDLDGDRPVFSGSLSVCDTALYWWAKNWRWKVRPHCKTDLDWNGHSFSSVYFCHTARKIISQHPLSFWFSFSFICFLCSVLIYILHILNLPLKRFIFLCVKTVASM